MQAVELIRKKRDGRILSTAEINWLIGQYTHEQVPDYQMSAWLMAVYWRGMDARETSDLTLAMAGSGEELHVRDVVSSVLHFRALNSCACLQRTGSSWRVSRMTWRLRTERCMRCAT